MKALIRVLMGLTMLLLAFGFGFAWRDLRYLRVPPTETVGALFAGRAAKGDTPLGSFKRAYSQIEGRYYRSVPTDKLRRSAMEGLFASLGDPYTQFMEPRAAKSFAEDTTASFGGVGASLLRHPLGARVRTVFPGGPAVRAGVKPNDVIVKVDKLDVGTLTVNEIVDKIRGPVGTTVRLTVLRGENQESKVIAIKRAQVTAPTVDLEILPGTKVGYMTVNAFAEPTTQQFDAMLDRAQREATDGLIIDLRWNPGGLLDTAVEMLSRFAEDKLVVKVRARDGSEEYEKTSSGFKRTIHGPVVVLVNEESASAAEIFSGVLKDYKLAKVIGTHTYGKAAVQRVWNLYDGSSAKITVAHYYLPSGRDLTRKVDEDGEYISGGIAPDIEVKLSDDDLVTIGDPLTDTQLIRSLEYVKSVKR